MNKALIYKIDRLNTHNGPGFRTVIYFKGCPLHCSWCHNPEGISLKPEVWFNKTKCIGCDTCVSECPEQALSLNDNGIKIDRNKCTGCQHCTIVCPTKAMEGIGKYYDVEELLRIILQDKLLFDTSGGGITVTGGEPGLYPDFITELFKRCQAGGIHTAFDTSGAIKTVKLDQLIPYTNTIFFDIKLLEESTLKHHTGLTLKQLYHTGDWLKAQKTCYPNLNIEFRTPLVPEVSDTPENIIHIAEYISRHFPGSHWELCLFNDLCQDKYIKMNMPWIYSNKKHSKEHYQQFQSIQEEYPNIKILVSGFVDSSDT